MMPRGFKPVGWVAAVGGAALSCYMLSLNVAAERAELAKLERQIVMAKQDIRSLQTELGTRGRLQQLEHWNAEVLALSAPTSAQFLDDAVTLARFEQRDKTIDEKAKVQMASMETGRSAPQARSQPQPQVARKLTPVDYAAAAARAAAQPQPLLRQASFTGSQPRAVTAVAKSDAKPVVTKVAAKADAPAAKSASAKAAPAKSIPVKVAEAKSDAKPVVKSAEARKAKPKAGSLKTVIAKLDDDKPSEGTSGAKSKTEAGLR